MQRCRQTLQKKPKALVLAATRDVLTTTLIKKKLKRGSLRSSLMQIPLKSHERKLQTIFGLGLSGGFLDFLQSHAPFEGKRSGGSDLFVLISVDWLLMGAPLVLSAKIKAVGRKKSASKNRDCFIKKISFCVYGLFVNSLLLCAIGSF